jgi:hypothetical protein
MKDKVISGTLINGVLNAVINGVIQWFSFKEYAKIPVSVDSITNNDVTVLGESVHLGVMLAMVLTLIAFFTIPKSNRPTLGKQVWFDFKAWILCLWCSHGSGCCMAIQYGYS